MESSSLCVKALVCAALLSLASAAETRDLDLDLDRDLDLDLDLDRDTRAVRDFYQSNPNLTNEKRLLGALHEVLEKLQTKKINPWEKKFGQVPTCDVGEHCAVRKGARIGKMCDCPRGAFCNLFLLKCL